MNRRRSSARACLVSLLVVALASARMSRAQESGFDFGTITPSQSGTIVQLPCGSVVHNTIASATPTGPAQDYEEVHVYNKTGVVFQGCGIDNTVITWNITATPGNTYLHMFDVGNSSEITFRDMTLVVNLNCLQPGGGTACSFPVSGGSAGGAFTALIHITTGSSLIRIERVRFRTFLKGDNDESPHGVFADVTHGTGDPVESVYVSSSKFETSGTGVSFKGCDDCWVEGSSFQDAPLDSPDNRRAYAFVMKTEGEGVRIVNNTFDMHANRSNFVAPIQGVLLWATDQNQSHQIAGEGAQISNNTFENMMSTVYSPALQANDKNIGVLFYGYNDANVSHNRFRCDPTLSPCATWVVETEGVCPSVACNRRNVFAHNLFDGFSEIYSVPAQTGFCPLSFNLKPGNAAGNSWNNLVVGNLFRLTSADSTSNGVCGTEGTHQQIGPDNLAYVTAP